MTVRDAAPARTVAVQGSAARQPEFDLDDDYFARQPTRSAELPDPEPLLRNLAHCVLESFAGARDLEQLARWVTDDVYRALSKRVVLAARARRVKGQQAQRPSFAIGRVHLHEPAEGVIEAVVMVHHRVRSRAVAIRLEGFDRRWRASAVSVL